MQSNRQRDRVGQPQTCKSKKITQGLLALRHNPLLVSGVLTGNFPTLVMELPAARHLSDPPPIVVVAAAVVVVAAAAVVAVVVVV